MEISIYVCHKNFFLCLVTFFDQWIPEHKERNITSDILNTHFHFQHSTKNGYKVGTIYKTEPFQAF